LIPPETNLRLRNTYRLVPSRYPSAGILDAISSPEDLDLVIELESWTNDRVSAELGVLHRIPQEEWVTGRPLSTVVMAAFCHPRPGGGRFGGPDRGAWYASLTLETAHAEVIYHRTAELAEIGVFETYVQERAYLADFTGRFHDICVSAFLLADGLHEVSTTRAGTAGHRIERRDVPLRPARWRLLCRVLPSQTCCQRPAGGPL
jgi:hypothetical protein